MTATADAPQSWRISIDTLALSLIAVVFFVWRLTAGAGAGRENAASSVVAVAAAIAGLFAVESARRLRGPIGKGWLAIAAGAMIWSTSVVIVSSHNLASGLSGELSLFHLGWTSLAVALAAGIILLGAPEEDAEARRKLVLDLLPTVIALSVAVWLAVFGPSTIASRSPWEARGAATVHALGAHVLLIAALTGALRRSRLAQSDSRRLLIAAAATFAVSDLLWLQPWRTAGSDTHPAAEIGFLVGFLMLGLAAIRSTAAPPVVESETFTEPLRRVGDWLQQIPHLSLFVLLALAGGQTLGGDLQPFGAETAIIGALAVVVFAMMRQGISLRHARKLRGEIGQLTEQIDGLIEQVGRDPLTGLLNRRAALGRIDHEVAHGRTCGHPVAVVLIDVDNFKTVNDTLGHQAGDRVLLAIGSILTAACRGTDVAARYAGDEFLLVLPGLNELYADHVCQRIVHDVRQLADDLDLNGVRVTLSVGAAVTHRCKRTATQLIAIADAAMYDAKEGGKDQVVAVDADTLTPASAGMAEATDTGSDVTYLPSSDFRAVRDRRSQELADRAS